MDLPYFFMYAKDKDKNSLDKINNSTLNRIVKEIQDITLLFDNIKNLDKIDYRLLSSDEYSNKEIEKIYIKYNKICGENLQVDEEEGLDKSNISTIVKQFKNELHKIDNNDDKIINALVKFLYSKNSTRKKRLLWFAYGDIMYNNLLNNIDKNTDVCMQCGKRTPTTDLVRHKCLECRSKELTLLNGHKLIKCVDCGKEFEVDKNSRVIRCKECMLNHKRKLKREEVKRYREKHK